VQLRPAAHYPHNEHGAEADRLACWCGRKRRCTGPSCGRTRRRSPTPAINWRRASRGTRTAASIVLWSVANETPVGEARTAFSESWRRRCGCWTDTPGDGRPAASQRWRRGGRHTDLLDDPLGADLDVLGCNEYLGLVRRLAGQGRHIDFKTIYNKPLIMSEFGADAALRAAWRRAHQVSEEYQESVYRHQVGMFKPHPFPARHDRHGC